jgi:hypothetical protein
MSITAVTPTVPVANDVIMGKFKAYVNYGLPTQTLLGATREGCKVDILRQIKLIEFDGAYGPTLDSDGVPLVRYEKLIGKVTLKSLYLKYFNRKIISDCESDGTWEGGDWSATGGTYAAETTIVNSGDQSAKGTVDTSQYGIKEVFASSKDLTAFDNSETSDTSDYIGFAIYITTQDKTDMGSADLRVSFHMDADETETNYYYYDVAASALTADQWTTFKVLKSAFTEAGTGNWAAVTGVSVKLDAAPSAEVVFYIDSIDLIQAQTDSSILPVNGSTFTYTDETTYKQYSPDLEIGANDYLENVTIIGQRMDCKKMKIVLKNAFNDGNIDLAFEDKDECVTETEFTGHYKYAASLACPIEIYEYVA